MTKILDKTDCISIEFKANSRVNIFSNSYRIYFLLMLLLMSVNQVKSQSLGSSIKKENVTFKSEGVTLAGTIYKPKISHAALVVVHGSGQESRLHGIQHIMLQHGLNK